MPLGRANEASRPNLVRRVFLVALSCATIGLFLSGMSPTPSPHLETGVDGTISIGPTRGGPIRPGVADSRPLANTEFIVRQGDREVASFVTDEQGRFRLTLEPGHYSVSLKNLKRLGHYGPFETEITSGQITHVNWQCDSGIR